MLKNRYIFSLSLLVNIIFAIIIESLFQVSYDPIDYAVNL